MCPGIPHPPSVSNRNEKFYCYINKNLGYWFYSKRIDPGIPCWIAVLLPRNGIPFSYLFLLWEHLGSPPVMISSCERLWSIWLTCQCAQIKFAVCNCHSPVQGPKLTSHSSSTCVILFDLKLTIELWVFRIHPGPTQPETPGWAQESVF